MNERVDCDTIQPLLEAYALGALDAGDQDLVALHLPVCAQCRALLIEYTEVAASLPVALAAVSPYIVPERLKESLWSQIQVPSARDAPAHPQAPSSFSEPSLMAPAARQHRKQNRWGLRFAFALASLLLILSLLWSVRLNVILARERARLSEYAGLVDQQEVVLEVVDAEDAVRRMLLPVEEYPTRPYGKIFSRSDMNHVVAMAARLPAVPAGEAYHLWVTQGGRMELAGLLNVNDDGFGLLVFDEDVNGPLYDSAQLTLQRLGEDAPSTAPILRWDATP